MSSLDGSLKGPLEPSFQRVASARETGRAESTISVLNLQPHPEGGYFCETDRDPLQVPNPFLGPSDISSTEDNSTRHANTSIYYFLTTQSPQGNFHRNRGRTVHTLHRGRGRYVIIHADEVRAGQRARVETFLVGQDIEDGERLQWIVEGGKYKASYLLPDEKGGSSSDGLLISETVIPGFDYRDHDFLEGDAFSELVTRDQAKELSWLLRT